MEDISVPIDVESNGEEEVVEINSRHAKNPPLFTLAI